MSEPASKMIARFYCPQCKGNPYNLWGMEQRAGSGVFEHRLWPGRDGEGIPPPDPKDLRCPRCRKELARQGA